MVFRSILYIQMEMQYPGEGFEETLQSLCKGFEETIIYMFFLFILINNVVLVIFVIV